MLSLELQHKTIFERIQRIVSQLMEEHPIYKEDLNDVEIVQHLAKVAEENISLDELQAMSDESLKERCDGVMSVQILAKIGSDFTSEQMAIFDEAIKRK